MKNDEIIFTVGNMDLKITKDGHIQVRANEGIATITPPFKRSIDDTTTELTSAFTTSSTTWVDVTGLSNLTKQQKSTLKQIQAIFKDSSVLIAKRPFQ